MQLGQQQVHVVSGRRQPARDRPGGGLAGWGGPGQVHKSKIGLMVRVVVAASGATWTRPGWSGVVGFVPATARRVRSG